MRTLPKVALAATSLILMLGVAACSPGGSAPSPSETPSAVDAGSENKGQTGEKADPGTGVINAVKTQKCETTKGAVTATGAVELAKGQSGDVTISVSWVKESTHAVIARGTTTLENVTSGDTVDWKIEADLPTSKGVVCVTGATIED